MVASAVADIKWVSTYPNALNQAKATKKLVMVEFYATWDKYGHQLESQTFANHTAQAVANKYVPVRVNVEKEGKELATKFHISNYPTLLFLDKNENAVGIIDGFESPDEFVKHGNTFLKDYADFGPAQAKYRSNPKNLDAITRLGVIYGDRYQISAALEKLAEAEKLDPANSTDKLSDLYNAVADHYQNASKFDEAIKYFQRAVDTSKVTDKRAYGYLSIVTCYFTMDAPADPQPGLEVPVNPIKLKEHLEKALPYVKACMKLPNLKEEDKNLARNYLDNINRILDGLKGG